MRPLTFLGSSVDGKSTVPQEFPKAPRKITLTRNTGKLKAWDLIAAAKESFPEAEIDLINEFGLVDIYQVDYPRKM